MGAELLIGSLLGGLASGLMSSMQKPLPPPPVLLPPPEPPKISQAVDVKGSDIVDSERAHRKALSMAAEQRKNELSFATSKSSKTAVNLTHTLLGE